MTMIRVTGVEEIRKVLDQLDPKDRRNALRRAVRAAGNVFKPAMRAEAAAKHLPKSFQKVRVVVSTHGRTSADVSAYVRPRSALFNILEPGAEEHPIGEAGRFLSNQKSEGRATPFFARGPVSHPGIASRAISPAAFAAVEDDAMKAFADVVMAAGPAAATEGA